MYVDRGEGAWRWRNPDLPLPLAATRSFGGDEVQGPSLLSGTVMAGLHNVAHHLCVREREIWVSPPPSTFASVHVHHRQSSVEGHEPPSVVIASVMATLAKHITKKGKRNTATAKHLRRRRGCRLQERLTV
ncbi:hypothetical protein RIF29_31218 [Crotalaria pallida]|uniref:Uncharacterized protein n=1 Tax=Crotalaria pallida TaxID=3830 RepID=A0AAN9HX37_CROPI